MVPEADDGWNDPRTAEAYREAIDAGVVYGELARALVDAVEPALGDAYLDLAAGTGAVSRRVLARVGREGRVVALDRAHAMLDVAKRAVPLDNFAALVADPARLPFARASFDGAVCSAAYWHFPARLETLRELRRVLRPGGRFAFNVPDSQLEDGDGVSPAPLFVALAAEGRRRFGGAPAPAGPVLSLARLSAEAEDAGLTVRGTARVDVTPTQAELALLAELAPFSARLYPDRAQRDRATWVRAALARVSAEETSLVRFFTIVLGLD